MSKESSPISLTRRVKSAMILSGPPENSAVAKEAANVLAQTYRDCHIPEDQIKILTQDLLKADSHGATQRMKAAHDLVIQPIVKKEGDWGRYSKL